MAKAAGHPRYMAVQAAAFGVGACYMLLGVLGFIPGFTAHYDRLAWAAHASGAQLFGALGVSGSHNVVHIAFGLAGLVLARTYSAARAYLLLGGLFLLAMWIFVLVGGHGRGAATLMLRGDDSWLHLGFGAVMVLLAITLAGQRDPTKPHNRAGT